MKTKELKKDSIIFILIYAGMILILWALFYKENFKNILMLSTALLFLLVIPGYLFSYFLPMQSLGEKIIIGSGIMLAISGIFSYLLGLLFDNFRYYFILHAVILLFLIYLNYFKKSDNK